MAWDGPTRSVFYEGAVGMLLIALLVYYFLIVAHEECYVVEKDQRLAISAINFLEGLN